MVKRKKIKDPLTCIQCYRLDQNEPGHIGTSKSMRCPDCADEFGKATLCRKCCPTEHGCKTIEEYFNENT